MPIIAIDVGKSMPKISRRMLSEILARMAWDRLPADATMEANLFEQSHILGDPALYQAFVARVKETAARPKIVCLCGSTRFWKEYQEANRAETLAGNIVLSVGFFVHAPEAQAGPALMETVNVAEKRALDELHLRKIDVCDEVLFLNVDGYMGESTRAELEYATAAGKAIRSLEPLG
jgi:hypothetical protein